MKITILTYGSRGDVQPFLALSLGLQRAGHAVKLAAPHRFAEFVEEHYIPFVPLAGDPEIISSRLNDAGQNPLRMVRAVSDYVFSIADQVARQAFAACGGADLIVHSFLLTVGGHSLARKFGIPDVSVQTFPMFAPTRAFPPVVLPGLPPGLLSYFFHWMSARVFWHGGNLGFKRLRKADPKSIDLELHWPFYRDEMRHVTPLLLAYSPTVLSRPADWSASHIHIPGYLFLEDARSYQPPEPLSNFLADGKPPVCVTFGSTIHQDAEHVYRSVLQAMESTGNRAIILSGWSDLHSSSLPEHILAVESVPHDWLFPRCATVVHHGGAGTTGAGLRAGIPNLVIPFASDQPFWGRCVHRLGAGPTPIPVRRLTAQSLIAALITAEGETVRSSARAVGGKIRAENGVHRAVEVIQQHAARWQA
jgi:sterol 3beta-glucosyltransferase